MTPLVVLLCMRRIWTTEGMQAMRLKQPCYRGPPQVYPLWQVVLGGLGRHEQQVLL